jgi:NAD(P)-dependent dehydrogenase (short-subunit alcohol dehydrogenase family)
VAANGGLVAVTDDGGGIGVALVDLLVEQGVNAELVGNVSANGYAGVVFLGGLRDVAGIDDAVRINEEAFRAARATGPSIGAFVTVSNLGGAFGCEGVDATRAWTSGLTGLARTVSIEWPDTRVKAIDVERGARKPIDVARSISSELLRGGHELEVGLRADGTRLTLRSAPVGVEYGAMPLGAADVIVVSGGGRGVTAATMIELARATKARFVLLGRSPLEPEPEICATAPDDTTLKRVLLDAAKADGRRVSPADIGRAVRGILANREIRRTIESIQQAGGDARYLTVDVTDAPSVAAALDGVRQEMGPITGVVHGAGVLADKRIVDKTDDQFDAVFSTKVQGLRALLSATATDPLKLLCVFSSVAARTGNLGQSDYAMANEVLNKVAVAERARRGPGCVVKSFGWGPWAGGMVDAGLAARFESMGIALLPLDVGARMLVDEISSPQTNQVEVLLGSATLGAPGPVAAGRPGA